MKKVLLMLALLPTAFTLQGCDDAAVAAGAGFVGGVIVGGAIADRDCGYSTRCSRYYDYWGNYRRSCRRVYYSCWNPVSSDPADKALAAMGIEKTPMISVRAGQLADRYHMSFDSAEKVVKAFDQAKQGDFKPFAKLGIGRTEMEALYKSENLPDRAIRTLAKELNIRETHARAMVKDMNRRVQEAR